MTQQKEVEYRKQAGVRLQESSNELDEDVLCDDVAWTTPKYRTSEIDKAGKKIIEQIKIWRDDRDNYDTRVTFETFAIIENWRATHSFPLNTFQNGLRKTAKKIGVDCLIAQRLKRRYSILNKLIDRPTMRLSQMQDVGGCRVIAPDIEAVFQFQRVYMSPSRRRHEFSGCDDYITFPKPSGYRGIHLMFRYQSDVNSTFNGLRIEIQIRSQLQHYWATAVETVGTFTDQALKSSKGNSDWMRFFALMGTAIAKRESQPSVPGTPISMAQLRTELRTLCTDLDALAHLRAFNAAISYTDRPDFEDSEFFLIELNASTRQIAIHGYPKDRLPEATKRYSELESKQDSDRNLNAVLVSVSSMSELKKAYPNYFLDTSEFVKIVEEEIEDVLFEL